MASKVKIKKGRKTLKERLSEMSVAELVIMILPLTVAAILLLIIAFKPSFLGGGNTVKANREVLLSTAGHWETFEDYGIDVWCPNDLAKEEVDPEVSGYQKLFVTRDKGRFPEIAFGVIVAPDADNRTFDLENDPSTVLDVTTPLLNEAFGKMINGAYPSTATDLDLITLASGQSALQGKGEATVTLVYQNAKDAEDQWSEETTTNLYYNVVIFHGRPVIVWGTWDYSTLNGESRTVDSVRDGVTSVMRADGQEVIEPMEDNWNTQKAVVNKVEAPEEPVTNTWDEDKQQWVNDQTGEVVDLPAPEDSYWDDKHLEDDPDIKIGATDADGNFVEYGEEGAPIVPDVNQDLSQPVPAPEPLPD